MNDINPINIVLLEGTVIHASTIKENDGKKYQDIMIDVPRKHSGGISHYSHGAVASDNILNSYGEFEVGDEIRIRGHLQESIYRIDDEHSFTYSKIRIDFVEG
jgi:hypothetical protein